MSPYQLTPSTGILRTADGAIIPPNPNNIDYQAYQAWIAAGNTADPVPSQTAPQLLATFKASAQAALDTTDTTMHRIAEAVSLGLSTWTTADVVAWVAYRRALRALLNATSPSALPTRPAFPAGT